MVTYFKETGINPKEKTKSTAEELSKFRNTVISFIREQEKKKLDPIILKVTEVMEFIKEYFQKGAVTKEDIVGLLQQSKAKPNIIEERSIPSPETRVEDDEKLRKFIAHVKSLFNEFASNFKSSALAVIQLTRQFSRDINLNSQSYKKFTLGFKLIFSR